MVIDRAIQIDDCFKRHQPVEPFVSGTGANIVSASSLLIGVSEEQKDAEDALIREFEKVRLAELHSSCPKLF